MHSTIHHYPPPVQTTTVTLLIYTSNQTEPQGTTNGTNTFNLAS